MRAHQLLMRCLPLVLLWSARGTPNTRPIIGVLTVPLEAAGCITIQQQSNNATSCFHSLYVSWLQSAGARVVPIPFDLSPADMLDLAGKLNGILFTGGETPIVELQSQYMRAARLLLNHTVQSPDYVPLWGTCMGLQTLAILVANDSAVLESGKFHGVDPKMLPLSLTPAADSSRMLGLATTPERIRRILSTSPVTTNLHHDGVSPETFLTNSKLSAFYKVLSTNVDAHNKTFVSTIEARTSPVYAAQWHPERPQFEWREPPDPINHSSEAIDAMQVSWLSNWLSNQLWCSGWPTSLCPKLVGTAGRLGRSLRRRGPSYIITDQ